jgi:hypothetical protein
MGKRELLLIIAFVIVGAVVYQATAPPPDPNERGFSIGKIIDHVRREVRGNRASIETVSNTTLPVDDEVTELRVSEYVSEVHITGEDRRDIDSSLEVHSRAYDEKEARLYAERTTLKVDRAGATLALSIRYPHEGRQQATLALRVPDRLRIRMEARPGKLTISNVAAVEAVNAGGNTSIKQVDGRVTVSNRGGEIEILDAGSLKITSRGSEVTIAGIRGDTSIVMDQGGELKASRLGGPLDVEARHAELALEDLESTKGPIRVTATDGAVRLKGVKVDTRVDARNCELEIVMDAAAPVAIYADGEQVSLTPPPSGYRLDAVVREGRIAPDALLEELGLQHASQDDGRESRVSGDVNGGGPTITIRATRSDVTLRSRDAAVQTNSSPNPDK